MQHLGSEEELRQAMRDVAASFFHERDLDDPDVRYVIANLRPDQLLAGLAPEQRLAGLTPEELERLRQLLQSREDKGGPSKPG